MSYRALYTRLARKDIERLDSLAQKRLKTKLVYFLKNSLKYATKLVDSEIGDYRWRVGNLRIIFDLDGYNVYITRIRHRRDVYKQL